MWSSPKQTMDWIVHTKRTRCCDGIGFNAGGTTLSTTRIQVPSASTQSTRGLPWMCRAKPRPAPAWMHLCVIRGAMNGPRNPGLNQSARLVEDLIKSEVAPTGAFGDWVDRCLGRPWDVPHARRPQRDKMGQEGGWAGAGCNWRVLC